MYDLHTILTRSPESIKDAIATVAAVVLHFLGASPTLLETAGVWIAFEKVLNLVYVKPVAEANALRAFEAVKRPLKAPSRITPK